MNNKIVKNGVRLLISQIIMWAFFILVDYISILLEESNEYLQMFTFLVPPVVILIWMSLKGVNERYILKSCKLPLRILYICLCTVIWCAGTWLVVILLCEAISAGKWNIVWGGELAGIEYVALAILGIVIPAIAAIMYLFFVICVGFPKYKARIHIVINTFLGVLLLRGVTIVFADIHSAFSILLPIVWAGFYYNFCYYKKQDVLYQSENKVVQK